MVNINYRLDVKASELGDDAQEDGCDIGDTGPEANDHRMFGHPEDDLNSLTWMVILKAIRLLMLIQDDRVIVWVRRICPVVVLTSALALVGVGHYAVLVCCRGAVRHPESPPCCFWALSPSVGLLQITCRDSVWHE